MSAKEEFIDAQIKCDKFFSSLEPPANLVTDDVDSFLRRHAGDETPVAIVTSGGTAIPIERNTVRFIENFSTGTRGAASTEHFLANGYAVVFLHRHQSIQPFFRHVSLAEVFDEGFHPENVKMHELYNEVKRTNRLLRVGFSTLCEYLWHLRRIAKSADQCGSRALVYLSAAVSDYYIPFDKMEEHKVQSGCEALTLHLEPVPKMVYPLRNEWCPKAFVVTFKLETQQDLLADKSRSALLRYGHQLVVGNLLDTRRREVFIYDQNGSVRLKLSDAEFTEGAEIEDKIISEVVTRHRHFHKMKEIIGREQVISFALVVSWLLFASLGFVCSIIAAFLFIIIGKVFRTADANLRSGLDLASLNYWCTHAVLGGIFFIFQVLTVPLGCVRVTENVFFAVPFALLWWLTQRLDGVPRLMNPMVEKAGRMLLRERLLRLVFGFLALIIGSNLALTSACNSVPLIEDSLLLLLPDDCTNAYSDFRSSISTGATSVGLVSFAVMLIQDVSTILG
ncbi:unnamed protein product [Notodromas monacha]|uniref:DNA/pantothenate metabolism flavoprotein C-terminal domain-containing protein n=1 Tax=Notodromas monacha TaxID=399045 RepID=A0A7R9GH25_9CRUS|nr:unnamed protein product [Notodromas monacha]CAG0921030.1 unnamed protein product [Notodromas monacha]